MDGTGPDPQEARARLMAERERLEHLLHDLDDEFRDSGGISTATGDAGADSTAADATIGLRNDTRHQLEEVDAALARVDDGTYGFDENTGEPIDPARLEAWPTARTNIR